MKSSAYLAARHVFVALAASALCLGMSPKPRADSPEALSIDLGNGVVMEFVRIDPGSFSMGSENSRADEKPATKVSITKPFYLGKFEVMQEQWQAVMEANPAHYQGANLPVEQVSWNDCQEFLAKLNRKLDRYKFRLPSEAEWEYACRAGTTTEYSFGDGEARLDEFGWFRGNAGRKTHPAGAKKPNPWGLFDMHGNVWEWCQDWYGPYPGGEVSDPTGASDGKQRVIRGGSWSHGGRDLWSSFRLKFAPDFRFRSIGVRIALTLR